MAELLDRMICIFPFEKELYESSGLPTDFAGHPLVDEMDEIRDASIERQENFVALLPGSREREIAKLYSPMLGCR
jgi:lipid-A-disaccharide synthase